MSYAERQIVIDPHTADGVYVARMVGAEGNVPVVCMETALPVKFEDTIKEALGITPPRPSRFEGLEKNLNENTFSVIDADAEKLKAFLRENI